MMARRLCVVILLLGLGLTGPCLWADDSDAAMDADLLKILQAVKAHKVETIADMMYTPFVDAAGGLDAVKAQAIKAQADAVANGLKIVSFDFIKPYKRVHTFVRDYRIITVHSVVEISPRQMEINGYWLAIKPLDSNHWQYLDGAGIANIPKAKEQFFPDLTEVPLPEVTTKVLQ
jgi:hypothetical protein